MVLGISGKRSIQIVLILTVASLWLIFMKDLNPYTVDLNFGIEFIGGVRIPISLEKAVDSTTMSTMLDTLKTRINKYGMAQFVVRPLGDREIIVEIPRASPEVIKSVESILKEQGKFEAIVDGTEALVGEDIMPGAVGGAQGERVVPSQEGVKWELDFAVSREGGERFSKASYGKANYPVYMFLDRPENAAIVLRRSDLNATNAFMASKVLGEALKKKGDDILLVYAEDWASEKAKLANVTVVIASASLAKTDPQVLEDLKASGFGNTTQAGAKKIVLKTDDDVVPQFYQAGTEFGIREWRAIGLLSAPTLSPGLATGYVSQFYSISGPARGETNQDQYDYAVQQIRELKSIISGGRLPVSTSVGSAYTVAPSLGEKFLFYSGVGCALAILAVSGIIIFRYRKVALALPIIGINVIEIIILTAVVGGVVGTLELSAMAGIIALIGTAVDDQIIVLEEMFKKRSPGTGGADVIEHREAKERLGRAFYIVLTTASISFLSMLPLLLSGIVEITGFALASMLEVVIGVIITRPAYGELIEIMVRRGMV
jgi:preprotein translocase subunit SecD